MMHGQRNIRSVS